MHPEIQPEMHPDAYRLNTAGLKSLCLVFLMNIQVLIYPGKSISVNIKSDLLIDISKVNVRSRFP